MDTSNVFEEQPQSMDDKIDFLYKEIRIIDKKLNMLNDNVARMAVDSDNVLIKLHKHLSDKGEVEDVIKPLTRDTDPGVL